MKKVFGTLLLLCCWLVSLQAQETTLVIYSTNDMHGSLFPFAKIARFLETERAKHPHVLVMSGGDMFSGNPVVDQYPQRGLPMIELMNQLGYNYAAIGNHELDYGQSVLTQCIEKAGFEMLCANVHSTDTTVFKQPRPYILTEVGGIRIGILGLMETTKRYKEQPIPSVHPHRLEGLVFTPPLETALQYKHLRHECDVFIGLFHTGYETDKEIAQSMPQLDVIIGGHSHTRIPSTRLINGVLVTQAGEKLQYIGKTTLTLKDKQLVHKQFELINVEELTEEDSIVRQNIQRYYNEIPLHEVLAQATAQFDGRHQLGALMADATRNACQTDFAFQNTGGVRLGMLPKGDVTLADVFRLDPFGNALTVYEMKASHIRTLLKNSYHKGDKSIDLIPAGLHYTLHVHHGIVTSVTLTDNCGRPLSEDQTYRIAMNNYIASSYDFDHSLPHQEMPVKATPALIEYLRQKATIAPCRVQRGTISEE